MSNRICLTCGKAYEYCGSCPTSLNLPVWKNLFDTENCKTIFETVSDYAQKVIAKDIAKEKLSNCDTSSKYKDNIQNYLDEIITEPKREDIVETENKIQSVPKIKYNKKKATTEISD